MISDLLIVVGLLCGVYGLFSFASSWTRRAGFLLLVGTCYYIGAAWTGEALGGVIGMATLLIVPCVLITIQARRLRLPLTKGLHGRLPPSRATFPHLYELTRELEDAGFSQAEDTGWDGGRETHFYRLFYDETSRHQASICLIEHGQAGVFFVTVSTRTAGDRLYISTDCPYGAHLLQAPGCFFNRTSGVDTMEALVAAHERFLTAENITEPQRLVIETDHISAQVSHERIQQVQHNIACGIIEERSEGHFRYSWRGCLYLWGRLFKDLVMQP